MLRRMKIGGRVNLLIAVPLLALIAFAALGYVALQNASVRGDEYKALKQAQDLRADTLPPPASLLEAWAEVNHIGVLAARPTASPRTCIAEIDGAPRAIDAAQSRLRGVDGLLGPAGHSTSACRSASSRWAATQATSSSTQVNDELKPAIAAGDAAERALGDPQHGVALRPAADRRAACARLGGAGSDRP